MSRLLKLATLVFIPTLSLGCAVKNSNRARLHKPDVICGPPIEFGYTVPQWNVLPAKSAACCLASSQTLSEYEGLGLIETPSHAAVPADASDELAELPPALPPQAAGRANALKPSEDEPTPQDAPALVTPEVPPPYPSASPSDRQPTSGSQMEPPAKRLDRYLNLTPVSVPMDVGQPQPQDWDDLNLPTLPWSENPNATPYQ